MCVFCSLVYVCASLLSMSLVFVVCVGFVSSFSCLCPPFMCVSFFFSCIGFPVSRVSWLVLCFLVWWVSLLGVLVPVCAVCLRWVYLLYCFRVLVFVSVVGGVCMCLMHVPLSLVSASFVCLFFICVSVCVCSCSFAGGRVWFYWRMCVSFMYMFLVSLVFFSCLSFFVL